ncbi:ABC transporter substrate-binding protein [Bowmanella denitrificans]|uniref:ABC transporter substrate-binding protein n=1 Tax=Bowmanella denitrificans TaxID=366582 RepID=UPI000C9D0F31|nr:ABC transporter substrate-binding protein [Bowmanella denitrificans]
MIKKAVSLVLLYACCFPALATSVMFVSPSTADDPFFSRVELFTRLAAQSLQLDLTVVYGDAHRIYQHAELEKRLANEQPDYLLVQVYSGSGKALFDLLKKYPKVKVISLEHLLLNHEAEEVGRPGEQYSNWIAEITFDNQAASELLSHYLLQSCDKLAQTGRHGVVGINGLHGQEALQRQAGLVEAVDRSPVYELHQVVNAKWMRDVAQQQIRALLGRYPDTSVIWSASDWMALGVADTLAPLMREGQPFCIGGFDWLPEVVGAIESGQLTASVGGHFMIGAWAMVMVYDHLHKALPDSVKGTNPLFSLALMHKDNVNQMAPLLDTPAWQNTDFRKYSLFHHPEQKEYRFSLISP